MTTETIWSPPIYTSIQDLNIFISTNPVECTLRDEHGLLTHRKWFLFSQTRFITVGNLITGGPNNLHKWINSSTPKKVGLPVRVWMCWNDSRVLVSAHWVLHRYRSKWPATEWKSAWMIIRCWKSLWSHMTPSHDKPQKMKVDTLRCQMMGSKDKHEVRWGYIPSH